MTPSHFILVSDDGLEVAPPSFRAVFRNGKARDVLLFWLGAHTRMWLACLGLEADLARNRRQPGAHAL